MDTYRWKFIKPFLRQIGVFPSDFDGRRGVSAKSGYVFCEFDTIIHDIGEVVLANLPARATDAFWLLYACKTWEHIQEELSTSSRKSGKRNPMKISTIERYTNDALKLIRNYIEQNSGIKEKLMKAVKDELAKHAKI